MNKLFNRLTFPVKLMLLGLIPLLFLIYFAVEIIYEKQARVKIARDVINNIDKSILVNKLASELHLERRTSFSYIFEKKTSADLIAQRNKTDAALAAVEENDDQSFDAYLQYSMLNQLNSQRNLILKNELSPDQALNYFSNVLERVNSFYNISVENIPYLETISKDLAGQRLMFNMVNHYGILRALIYSTAVKKTYTEQEYNDIQKTLAITLSYIDEFKAKASTSAIVSFNKINSTEESKYCNQILSQISKTSTFPPNFDAENWWSNSRVFVDDIIKVQEGLTNITKENTELILEKENKNLYLTIILLIIIIILVVTIISYTIKNINDILNNLRIAAEKIALGESNLQLDVINNDSIGSLAKSIKIIDINNNELAKAADSIGKGEFDITMSPRSERDILGSAVVKMKEDLQKYSIANASTIWIQSGLTAINNAVRGEKLVNDLSNDVLNCLVSYLGAQVGLFYNNDNDILNFAAGYALNNNYNPPKTLTLGQTLIGEAAKQKKVLYLDEIPDNYLTISSASGSSLPKYILVVPLIHNNIVEGVIEIGAFKPFSKNSKSLIEQASNSIAIAVHSSKSRTKLQELLEETQAQSEELQTQHSELEGLNTELEAQAQKLQASEEELKVQQEELLQANKELEERSKSLEEKNELIVERNLDIQKKAEELELSTKYKSEFLANMSHELRTPLNSILLLSRLMYENPEENLTTDQIEYAQVIQSSGNGLLLLIDEILDLSKIEAGKMELEYADVLVKDIVTDMKLLFAPIAKDKNLEFIIDVSADVPQKISTDKMRLEQIIKNLLSNAIKFTSKGSVSLTVKPTNNPLVVQFSIKDTGIGIAKDKQLHVFEAFQQADGSTRRRFGGTGLGLSISRELAKLLGGEIILESKEELGSEFTLHLPIYKIEKIKTESIVSKASTNNIKAEEPVAKQPERIKYISGSIPEQVPDDRENITNADKVILIVEDDTNFAKALLNYTRKSGYKGVIAVRGDAGIEMATIYNPKAILLDIQLPVKDGWEVMEELKTNPVTRHIPVHIMSSLEVKKESLIKGAVDFINKPVALEQMKQMFSKLESVFDKHPKKVLIIEENPKHAKALAYFLETFNVNSEIKGSVSEGIQALQRNDVECVILDMGIPDQNAYETLDQIKKNPGLENLPIIIFTGKNLSKAEEGRLKYYADSIVMKTAHSYQRILDEVALFLHIVEEKEATPKEGLPKNKNVMALNEILKGKTVLVADDDVRNIYSLTKALEQLKMKVLSATDGKEALKVLEENPQTDIVLMDMMMPEMDGYESTALIRQHPKFKNLPILAVTAKAMVGDREKCINAGASDYISKPVDIDQLISLLRVWLYDKHF